MSPVEISDFLFSLSASHSLSLSARHVSIFSWCLKAHVLGRSNDEIITTMLPNPSDALFITSYQRKTPAAIIMRLRYIFDYLAEQGKLDKEVYKAIFQTISNLNKALMITERIRNSPLPPMYTAHTTRLLLFYLFWLPLALCAQLQSIGATLLITLAVGYSMFGLDEISHLLELPFKLMPLRQLSKLSMMDSADAIIHRPPPISKSIQSEYCPPIPEYWYHPSERSKFAPVSTWSPTNSSDILNVH